MSKLIDLAVHPERPGAWKSPNCRTIFPVRQSLPFVENSRAVLVHRVKHMEQHQLMKRAPHLAIHMWCGSGQNGSSKFTFHADPPRDKLVCQRCETEATLAGQPSSTELVGRHVCLGGVKAFRTCIHISKREFEDFI